MLLCVTLLLCATLVCKQSIAVTLTWWVESSPQHFVTFIHLCARKPPILGVLWALGSAHCCMGIPLFPWERQRQVCGF